MLPAMAPSCREKPWTRPIPYPPRRYRSTTTALRMSCPISGREEASTSISSALVRIWPGTRPITRARPDCPDAARSATEGGRACTGGPMGGGGGGAGRSPASLPRLIVRSTRNSLPGAITQKSATLPGTTAPRSSSPNRPAALRVAIRTASSIASPCSMAVLMQSSICPFLSSRSAWRSSVANEHLGRVQGFTTGRSAAIFRSVDPSLIMRCMPRRSFSRASAAPVDSWSLCTPARI